jgi:fused signal recognition particle receptor
VPNPDPLQTTVGGRDGIIAPVPASQWKKALSRTRQVALARLGNLVGITDLGEPFWQTLEACLIQADVGVDTAESVVAEVRQQAQGEGWRNVEPALGALGQVLVAIVDRPIPPAESAGGPEVILLVGVNGSGKTTSAAKLAYRLTQQGRSVLLAAADTFRAAGAEQLGQWAERLGLDITRGADGSDPAAVAYQAIESAVNRSMDAVVVDTSGRMHTSHNLMAELAKIVRVSGKALPGAPHQTLIVLDATTGQNALAQADAFAQATSATGVVLAKLDSSAKGGIGLAVVEQLNLPICYVGMGEGREDLVPFDPDAYVEGLLADLSPAQTPR